jgi:hypothetical protein
MAQLNSAKFGNVATKPILNSGLGDAVSETGLELDRIYDLFPLLCECHESLRIWRLFAADAQLNLETAVGLHAAQLTAI